MASAGIYDNQREKRKNIMKRQTISNEQITPDRRVSARYRPRLSLLLRTAAVTVDCFLLPEIASVMILPISDAPELFDRFCMLAVTFSCTP